MQKPMREDQRLRESLLKKTSLHKPKTRPFLSFAPSCSPNFTQTRLFLAFLKRGKNLFQALNQKSNPKQAQKKDVGDRGKSHYL
jgi:hypothetical protein